MDRYGRRGTLNEPLVTLVLSECGVWWRFWLMQTDAQRAVAMYEGAPRILSSSIIARRIKSGFRGSVDLAQRTRTGESEQVP